MAFCSAVLVSVAAVLLEPRQTAHLEQERQARLDALLDGLPELRALMREAGADALVTRPVDLTQGRFSDAELPATYDPVAAADDPAASTSIPPEADLAGLKRRENLVPVHLLARDGELALIVLPLRGRGYASMIRAYLALEPDLKTVAALTIVEQGETPGLGARIEDPAWQAMWAGKQTADETGRVLIEVVRGVASGPFEVDGITGATRTGNGVTGMLRFWLGDWGYGPFLDRLAAEGL